MTYTLYIFICPMPRANINLVLQIW